MRPNADKIIKASNHAVTTDKVSGDTTSTFFKNISKTCSATSVIKKVNFSFFITTNTSLTYFLKFIEYPCMKQNTYTQYDCYIPYYKALSIV